MTTDGRITGEPRTINDVETRYPRWHAWIGISGLWYASRRMTSPPVLIRAEDAQDLCDQINGWIGQHSGRADASELAAWSGR